MRENLLMTGGFISMLDFPWLLFLTKAPNLIFAGLLKYMLFIYFFKMVQSRCSQRFHHVKDARRRAVFVFFVDMIKQNQTIACTVDGEITMEKVKLLIKMEIPRSFSSALVLCEWIETLVFSLIFLETDLRPDQFKWWCTPVCKSTI